VAPPKTRKFENSNTRFGKFSWAECPKLKRALDKFRDEMRGQPLPVRFKIKL
jgi:hypothetical protein